MRLRVWLMAIYFCVGGFMLTMGVWTLLTISVFFGIITLCMSGFSLHFGYGICRDLLEHAGA